MKATKQVKPGARFGRWTVLSFVGEKKWLCRCDCSTERPVLTSALNCGRSKSCGCTIGERARAGNRAGKSQHGMTGTPTWLSWVGMIQRCLDPNHESYRRYGGAGVSVCERWQTFENFFADMGERPEGLTLDREDGTKGYEPGNCRWATREQQSANRDYATKLTIAGRTLCLAEWARERGISYSAMIARRRRGWSDEEVLGFTPRDRRRRAA